MNGTYIRDLVVSVSIIRIPSISLGVISAPNNPRSPISATLLHRYHLLHRELLLLLLLLLFHQSNETPFEIHVHSTHPLDVYILTRLTWWTIARKHTIAG